MPLIDKLKGVSKPPQPRTGPLWSGPCGEGKNGGITFSALSRFLQCRERFRLHMIEGLKPLPTFHAPIEFGNMWHACEEALAGKNAWQPALINYSKQLCTKYRTGQEQIEHWFRMCKAMFPIYVEHWAKHPDVRKRIPIYQEKPFDIKYPLPSSRVVRLRGKFDAVDLIDARVYLQENKTKSQINEGQLKRQLSFDLQTMIYIIALPVQLELDNITNVGLVSGVRYNVIRRSAHKSVESMLKKLTEDAQDGRIGEWFARWRVEITTSDVVRFRSQCLDPILEQLCDWYDWVENAENPFSDKSCIVGPPQCGPHWRHPFGIRSILDEGGSTDLDAYLETGSEVGLQRVDKLFEETT